MLTIRDEKYLAQRLGDKLNLEGMGSIARYALLRFFAELSQNRGAKEVKLGGSETEGLDRFKRQLWAEEDRTQWAYLVRE